MLRTEPGQDKEDLGRTEVRNRVSEFLFDGFDGNKDIEGKMIKFVPLWKWLLFR